MIIYYSQILAIPFTQSLSFHLVVQGLVSMPYILVVSVTAPERATKLFREVLQLPSRTLCQT
ncbi:hypothetical protein BDV39DRAFT_184134, partial [Aspergillus sergii]